MTNIVLEHNRTVQDLEDRYRAEGYLVLHEPAKEEMPDFLRYFHPDLIATRGDRSVVVEVKSPGKVRRADYWRELADTVRSHPGWHLEVVANAAQEPPQESISPAEVVALVDQSATLADAGEYSPALLIAWAAAEAAMRLAAERYDVEIHDLRPPSLMSRLFSEGLMDRPDYDFLMTCMRQRNAVAHGFRQQVTPEDLKRLQEIVNTLLTE